MKKYFKLFSLALLICTIVISSTTCFADVNIRNSQQQNSKVLYIKDRARPQEVLKFETPNKNIETKSVSINEKLDKSNIEIDRYQAICLSKQYFIENKETLKSYFQKNKRIIVLSDKMTKKELVEALGAELPVSLDAQTNNINKSLTQLGIMIYKTPDDNVRMIGMNVEQGEDEMVNSQIIEQAILDSSTIDAANYNDGKFGLVSTTSLNSWNSMISDANIDYWQYIRVRWTFQLYKDPSNPAGGIYKTCADYYVKPEMTNSAYTSYILDRTYVTVGANTDSKILSVSPSDQSSFNTSFSVSFPWGATVSLTGSNVSTISTVSGGPASNQVTKVFYPAGWSLNDDITQEAELIVTAQRTLSSTSYSGSYTVYYTELQFDGSKLGSWYAQGGKTLSGSAAN